MTRASIGHENGGRKSAVIFPCGLKSSAIFVLVLFYCYLALGAAAVGLPGALGLPCSGQAMTSVTTLAARIGPKGTSAENSLYLSGMKVVVTFSFGTCWPATPIFISGSGRARGVTVAPSRKKRTRLRGATDAQHMQKRAKSARPFAAHKFRPLRGVFLALGAAAVGLPGALGLPCSGQAMTSVTTLAARIGPKGTSAENSRCRTGWFYQQGPRTHVVCVDEKG